MTLPAIHEATLPERYIAAQHALAECSQIDECKEWQDRAAAMASYARQAEDQALERMAQRIRVRAVNRLGELLRAQKETVGLNRGTAGTGDANVGRGTGGNVAGPPVDTRPTLAEAGISKRLSSHAQRISAMPRDQFEAAVEADRPPSIAQLAASATQQTEPATAEPAWAEKMREDGSRPGFRQATAALGTLRTFAEFCEANPPHSVARGVLPHEAADAHRRVSVIDGWLDRFIANLPQESA